MSVEVLLPRDDCHVSRDRLFLRFAEKFKGFEAVLSSFAQRQRGQCVSRVNQAAVLDFKGDRGFHAVLVDFDQLDPRGREGDVAVNLATLSLPLGFLQLLPPSFQRRIVQGVQNWGKVNVDTDFPH